MEGILPQNPDGNFVLYVSNQSFAITPVDIEIDIDGKHAIQDEFDVTGNSVPQHNWIRFIFRLSPGTHKIRASSKHGEARIKEGFRVEAKHWAVLEYWYYPTIEGGTGPTPKSFTFHIQNTPVHFE